MFYIDKKIFNRQDEMYSQVIPSLVVFAAFFLVTLMSWASASESLANERREILIQKNIGTSQSIQQTIESYDNILRGAVGLFEASQNVTRDEWKAYVDAYNIERRFSGIKSIGYVEIIPDELLNNHINYVRNQGLADYKIHPDGKRDYYSTVVYIEPHNDFNQTALGYDLSTSQVRQQAMDKARDTGEITLSRNLYLIQDKLLPNKPAFLLLNPIYSKGTNPSNVEERRENIKGFAYIAFRANEFINSSIVNLDSNYAFKVSAENDGKSTELYQTSNYESLINDSPEKLQTMPLELTDGNSLQITGAIGQEIVDGSNSRPSVILWIGTLLSLFIAVLLYLLLLARSRALKAKEEEDIQEAKDELLALASHQLRTPATGVKQYLGMLREGFVGDLTPLQKKMLDKAYASNERQLGTINEMLFVARADAGHLKMDAEKINLNDMVASIVDEQRQAIKDKGQKLKVKIQKNPIIFTGDSQYLRMAFENILSNASKYTPNEGSIEVSLRNMGKYICYQVTDTGVGVANEDMSLLFKKFARIPNELTNKVSGSGIGLYLAKKVIDNHGGQIKFTSTKNKGSVVQIVLPYRSDREA